MIQLAPAQTSAKSHLAFALFWLPPQRRLDALVFFRFCRVVDDIADEPGRSEAEKNSLLGEWEDAILSGDMPAELARVVEAYGIEKNLLAEIVCGCRSDIRPQRFQTFSDLEGYCWRVACAVGLVSIRIFGCESPESASYAVHLGHALQLTNILRDVGEDAAAGRIYLPTEDLARFGVEEAALLAGCPPPGLRALMLHGAGRARARFRASVPPEADRHCLLAPEIMKALYWRILGNLEREGFPVFRRRLRLGRTEKFRLALAVWMAESRHARLREKKFRH